MSYRKYIQVSMYIGALFFAVLGTVTCNLQPISSVRIKASPKLYVPLGSRSFSAEEYFSADKIAKMVSGIDGTAASNKKVYVYNYTPSDAQDKDQLRFLVRYPLQSFNLDLDSYFGSDIAADASVLSRKFDTDISIPSIQVTKQLDISAANINEKLLEKFNNSASPYTIPISAGTTGTVTPSPVNISFQGFETISFDSGSDFFVSTTSDSVTYRVVAAKIRSNGIEIPGTVAANDRDVQFSLSNREIHKNTEIVLTVNITSGAGNINISRLLFGRIKQATGVNTDTTEIMLAPESVDMPLPEDFCSATIGSGELKLSMESPADWTGIVIEEQTVILQDGVGGLSISPASFQPLGTSVSLAGKTLNNQQRVTYTPKIKVKLTDATYTYQDNLAVNFNVSVGSFSTITLKNREDFNKMQVEPVPDGMKTWVKKIHFNTVSAKIKLNNGLPAGNPIKIKLSSGCFQMPEQEKTFNHGEEEQTYSGGSNFDLDIEHLNNFDLSTNVFLPGYNAIDKTFTLHNINTNSKIKFSGAVQFKLDWAQMTVKAEGNKTNFFPQDKDIPLSFTSPLKNAKITLNKMPMYFYAGTDSDLLSGAKVKIALAAEYVKDDSSRETVGLSNDLISRSLCPLPSNVLPQQTGAEFTGKIPTPLFSVENLHEVINKYPSGLRFKYSLSMDGDITITNAQYKALKNSGKKAEINVDILVDMPIGFSVKENDSEVSLSSLSGDTIPNDLLGKMKAQYKTDVLNLLRSVQLDVNLKNESEFTPSVIFRAKNSTGDIETKPQMLKTGTLALSFDSTEWKKLMSDETTATEIYFKFEKGLYTIKKGFELKAALSVVAGTEIDKTYSLK